MDTLDHLRLATAGFDEVVTGVAGDAWQRPTPCDGWDVRDLVDHVIGGNRMAVALLDGASFADALDAVLAAGFGDDVVGELRASTDAQLRAFTAPGAWDRVCHHPSGDVPGSRFAEFRIGDLTVHTWDLARAVGGDERLDERLVARSWDIYRQRGPALAASGMFGAGSSGALDDGAPLQDRLLDLVGRRP